MVAEVRDDPEARIRLAADTYALRPCGATATVRTVARSSPSCGGSRRGVCSTRRMPTAPGSPWWRAVNEALLRDTLEAKLLVEREDLAGWRRHDRACSTGSASSDHPRRGPGTWPTTRASSPDTWRIRTGLAGSTG